MRPIAQEDFFSNRVLLISSNRVATSVVFGLTTHPICMIEQIHSRTHGHGLVRVVRRLVAWSDVVEAASVNTAPVIDETPLNWIVAIVKGRSVLR